ncbi:MAG: hypothetical protein JJE17_00910 [Peptostreptococcaceae bacterium]|nr:hypothetical protein [Peptostreptococcaceae bacterium]
MEFEIIRNIAILGQKSIWTKELNVVRWNRKIDKFDIRDWTSDHLTMSRGITLNDQELANLKDALNEMYETIL